jgi:hypothetical protein
MPEPTATSFAALAAGISALTLAAFGVDYYSLLYALIGAMFALYRSEQMTWGRAVVYVLLATLTGAVLGNLAAGYIGVKPPRIVLIGLCLAGGIVAQAIASALLDAAPRLSKIVVGSLERVLRRVTGTGGKP